MVERADLIDAMVNRIVDEMDTRTLVQLAYETVADRFDSYSDEELRDHAAECYPEILEELDELSEGV